MTDLDLGLIIGAVIGFWAATIWHRFVMWRTVRLVEKFYDKPIAELINLDELNKAEKEKVQELEMTDLKAEYQHGMLYIYDDKTDQFLAQGRTITEVNDLLIKKLGAGKNFKLKFDLPEDAVKRIYKDINQ
jgi:hypothetical protein